MTTFAAETYGRMSEVMLDTINEIALYAAQSDRAKGLQPRRRAVGWRAAASAVIAKCTAEAWIGATAYPCGTNPRPARYVREEPQPALGPPLCQATRPTSVAPDQPPAPPPGSNDRYLRSRAGQLRTRFAAYRSERGQGLPYGGIPEHIRNVGTTA